MQKSPPAHEIPRTVAVCLFMPLIAAGVQDPIQPAFSQCEQHRLWAAGAGSCAGMCIIRRLCVHCRAPAGRQLEQHQGGSSSINLLMVGDYCACSSWVLCWRAQPSEFGCVHCRAPKGQSMASINVAAAAAYVANQWAQPARHHVAASCAARLRAGQTFSAWHHAAPCAP